MAGQRVCIINHIHRERTELGIVEPFRSEPGQITGAAGHSARKIPGEDLPLRFVASDAMAARFQSEHIFHIRNLSDVPGRHPQFYIAIVEHFMLADELTGHCPRVSDSLFSVWPVNHLYGYL